MTTAAMVELDAVSKVYSGGVRALSEVTLRIDPGELVAIVGPSGSGKSTLLHLAGALDRPSAGTVRLAGRDLTAVNDRGLSALRARTIGFVFQQFHLPAGVRALDAVADGLLYTGLRYPERVRRALAALERVGLSHRLDHRPHELSGGERQRVAIARALVREPALVLADEPTGNLDSAAGEAVVSVLKDRHDAGAAVLVITHNLELAAGFPRRIRMRDGAIVGDDRV
jgi:putative ABC transport system ATP-binding protein